MLAAAGKAAGAPASRRCYELTVSNADKGTLPLDVVKERVQSFQEAGLPVLLTQVKSQISFKITVTISTLKLSRHHLCTGLRYVGLHVGPGMLAMHAASEQLPMTVLRFFRMQACPFCSRRSAITLHADPVSSQILQLSMHRLLHRTRHVGLAVSCGMLATHAASGQLPIAGLALSDTVHCLSGLHLADHVPLHFDRHGFSLHPLKFQAAVQASATKLDALACIVLRPRPYWPVRLHRSC